MTPADEAAAVVHQLLPAARPVPLDTVLAGLAGASVAPPFAAERVDFVADLSRTLARRARGLPEAQALAFWMRRAELSRMASEFGERGTGDAVRVPRGTVFHVPPANVDTIFVYSLVLSLLAGNRNIVRLSSRATEQSQLILESLAEVLDRHPQVAPGIAMITYGHEEAITAAISAQCDTRVIWGGDGAVAAIRRLPLPVHATELTFPDRFSLAAIGTAAYAALSAPERDDVADRFFNDAYWFDQLGCSSPRLLAWVDGPRLNGKQAELDEEGRHAVAADFQERLRAVIERRAYAVDTSLAIAKLAQSMGSMIDDQVLAYHRYGNALTVIDVADFPSARGEFCGGGLFYQLRIESLADLAPHVRRQDQTLTHFGLADDDLRGFVALLCGRGLDRLVPMGQALTFDRVWDGYDLLDEFVRRVTVRAGQGG